MTISDLARTALESFPVEAKRTAHVLIDEVRQGSITARLVAGTQAHTVVWEFEDSSSRVVCSCGESACAHAAAVLVVLAGEEVPPRPDDRPPRPAPAPFASAPAATDREPAIAEATMELVRQTCIHGLRGDAKDRDDALARVLDLLRDLDVPDLKRAVASLRRSLTSTEPDPALGGTALFRLTTMVDELQQGAGPSVAPSDNGFGAGEQRREEVRLLEVGRDTQRTPFGERRDVSYFLDLDARVLLRELASARPGAAPRMSEGPFPKLLLGNLVSIEDGPSPQRIRMLQYTSAGSVADHDLDVFLGSCQTHVDAVYRAFRSSAALDGQDRVVLFAPDRVIPSTIGVVLADEAGACLPLARRADAGRCAAVDHVQKQGTILAVVGPLVQYSELLAILPLTVLVEIEGRRTLRRIR
jgi:hypothetical protein